MRKELVKILSSVVNGSDLNDYHNLNEKEWDNIYDEANAHSLEGIVYYAIKKNNINVKSKRFEEWKKGVCLSNIHQDKHVNVVSTALNKLKESGVPVMVLKGMALRDLYPKSELRSMTDADILVRVEDLDLTCEILENLGYETSYDFSGNESYIVFYNEFTKIEVHWDLVNDEYFNGKNSFDTEIWENANDLNIKGVECFTLGNEDLVVHLLTHMMVHLSYIGFGLRQILDLAFVISKNKKTINWKGVLEKIEKTEILKFALYIFEVCEKLFDIELPGDVKNLILTSELDEKYVNLFIEDIFNNGNFERENIGECFSVRKLKAPFAWIHHIFTGLFNKDYCFSEKRKFFSLIKNVKKRKMLLKYLEAE
ncbi:MAG: nucleotidyltransferase domain-containing protein [Sarcina sp.]